VINHWYFFFKTQDGVRVAIWISVARYPPHGSQRAAALEDKRAEARQFDALCRPEPRSRLAGQLRSGLPDATGSPKDL
jgi:hypothetical protein